LGSFHTALLRHQKAGTGSRFQRFHGVKENRPPQKSLDYNRRGAFRLALHTIRQKQERQNT
jgi:hypothetical protein